MLGALATPQVKRAAKLKAIETETDASGYQPQRISTMNTRSNKAIQNCNELTADAVAFGLTDNAPFVRYAHEIVVSDAIVSGIPLSIHPSQAVFNTYECAAFMSAMQLVLAEDAGKRDDTDGCDDDAPVNDPATVSASHTVPAPIAPRRARTRRAVPRSTATATEARLMRSMGGCTGNCAAVPQTVQAAVNAAVAGLPVDQPNRYEGRDGATEAIARTMMLEGWRFCRCYRHEATPAHAAVYAVVATALANHLADDMLAILQANPTAATGTGKVWVIIYLTDHCGFCTLDL